MTTQYVYGTWCQHCHGWIKEPKPVWFKEKLHSYMSVHSDQSICISVLQERLSTMEEEVADMKSDYNRLEQKIQDLYDQTNHRENY